MDFIFAITLLLLIGLFLVDHFVRNDELSEMPAGKIIYILLAGVLTFSALRGMFYYLRHFRVVIDTFINFDLVYGSGHGFIFKMIFKLWYLLTILRPFCHLLLAVAVIDKAALGGKVFDSQKVLIVCIATIVLMILIGFVFPFILNIIVGPEYWRFAYNFFGISNF